MLRPYTVRSWLLPLSAAFAISSVCAGAGYAVEPTPYRTPLYWGDLPAPTALVHLKTSLGTFMLPMGYLSDWYTLKDQAVSTAPDGLRQFTSGLEFQFVFPGGGISLNPQRIEEIRDEKGAVVPGRTTVFVMDVKPPDARRDNPEIDVLATGAARGLVRDPRYSRGSHEVLTGVVAGRDDRGRVGVSVGCEENCHFRFYLERENLTMEGVMDGAFRWDGLAIAEQAYALFIHWKTSPSGVK